MRGGPGLGNIAPSQADYFQATKGGGHGDYHMIVLAPASVKEAFDLTFDSFELADIYRSPVMILGDGLLGQMMEPIKTQNSKFKTQNCEKPWALTGCVGREPNVVKSLLLKPGELEELNKVLQATYEDIKTNEVKYESIFCDDAELIVVAYGTTSRICRQAVKELRNKNLKLGMIRPITLWPFPEKIINECAKKTKKFLVVEMSAGQMVEDVRLSVDGQAKVYFYGRMGGEIPTQEEVTKEALRHCEER
jgi:2-oxoglutarate ferredoxin oxidoreductase subunit alpha